jgi:hypothetical protein
MTALGSTDVMRFLGRRIPRSGEVPKRFHGEVVSNVKEREEGVRLKHFVNGNSEKLYDKAYTEVGSVLRPECTIHNVEDLRAYPRRLWKYLLRRCRLAVSYPLAIPPALPVAFLFARRRRPVPLLSFPVRPLPRCLPALRAAIALACSPRTKPPLASFQQALAASRPALGTLSSCALAAVRLACTILGRAHGR